MVPAARSAARPELLIAPVAIVLFFALQGADRTLPFGWALLTLGGLIGALAGAIDLHRPLSAVDKAIGFALAGCALSIALGLDPRRSLMLSVPTLAGLLVWILITRDRYPIFGHLPVAIGFAAAAIVQSTLLVLAVFRHPYTTPGEWVADAGAAWLIVPNDVAWIACILPLLAIGARHRKVEALAVLLAAFFALCLLVHSRTAAIVALAVALSFVALSFRCPRVRLRRLGWIAAVFLGAAVIASAFGVASMHARLQLWETAGSIFLDHPWTGVGLHNFVFAYRQYLPPSAELVDPRITPWPHNLLLEIAAECGLIGLAAMFYLAGCVVRRGMLLDRTMSTPLHRAAFAGLFGMVLLALVEASLLRQWVWLVGAALCALLVGDARVLQRART